MTNNKPREFDAVLGKQVQTPIYAVVLGGIEGVKKRLLSTDIEIRIIAVKDALNYEEAGLILVIQALSDKNWKVRQAAYLLLESRQEVFIQNKLQEYNQNNNRFDAFVAMGRRGKIADIDTLMESLENEQNSATYKLVDYTLGLVNTNEGMERIKYYLFNGTQTQRNYAALYFKRLQAKDILTEAVKQGCIDKIQAFSK
jgi:HEAT repeat protein